MEWLLLLFTPNILLVTLCYLEIKCYICGAIIELATGQSQNQQHYLVA